MRLKGLLTVALAASISSLAAAHGGIPLEIAALDSKLDAETAAAEQQRAEWLVERAALQRLRGDFGAALADLNEAYELAPELPELCFQRGMVFAKIGFGHEADDELSYFLESRPGHRRALATRAFVRALQGHISAARADYRAALEGAPDIELYLALCKLSEEQSDLDLAASCYTRGLGDLHDAVVLKLALIRVETDRRNYRRAIELVDTLIASSALKADAYLRRAEIYEKEGKDALAERDRLVALAEIDAAMAKRPSALRRLTRAKALLALGRQAEGERDLETAVEQAPSLEEARELLRNARER